MPDGSLVFPKSEFQRRTTALQSRMDRAEVSALLLTSQADIFYTTGFLTRFWESPARPWFVIVPLTGKPVAVIPSIGSDLMERTWISDIRTWSAPDPADDGVSLLVATLADLVPQGGIIATPMGLETHLRMPLADFKCLEAALAPRRRLTDGTHIVQRVREVKSEVEIEKIRATCQIADAAFGMVPGIVAANPRPDLIFRLFQMALLEAGADWVSYTAGGAGPGGYGDVISPAGAETLQFGDVLMLDTGAVKDGYFCDFDRNFAIGPLDKTSQQAHAALYDATDRALQEMRPGMRASDVHALLSNSLRGQGATPCEGRLGHGLGITLTEWPSFTPLDQTVLIENMVLTLEPSVEIAPGRMIVHEENIVLRADGPELLSCRAPEEMLVITL